MPAKSVFSGPGFLFPAARLRREAGRSSPAQRAVPEPTVARKRLYAVDGRLTAASPVTEIGELAEAARAAVRAGQGHVLDTSHVIFPNGAVTLVLILAESHLAIHTWPEEGLIAIDLFSCGAIAGEQVITELTRLLRLEGARVQQVRRGAGGA
jgi:S-adenosylmethionine decarboxylase